MLMAPKLITISGISSNSGKTTLLCELLRALSLEQRWEAIKLTRGHYRSCGKDLQACCVSDLLRTEAVIRSGRAETYALGKDTGRYWDAGATNVHWVIATDDQVESGINAALARVTAPGVLLEGTSLLNFLRPDFALLVVGGDSDKLKPSARRALQAGKIHALYVTNERAAALLPTMDSAHLPRFAPETFAQLLQVLPV